MLTEEEARERWCPFYQMVGAGTATDFQYGDNRPVEIDNDRAGYCIASDCAAWRWNEFTQEPPHVRRPVRENGGYCGLAGKP